ncbi:BGTF surface domain-containing protein [Halomicrobium zhouii]|uniref:BGTF surface domain-containing protein n=1 Tax=Halomicrobium zhouii TaxID=767519 RepID=UPI000B7DB6CC|nr:BGTF surface domain-containing protein [Halomicrobium zhouii]
MVHDGEELVLDAAPGQPIEGHATLEPGSTVEVTVQSESPKSPFLTRSEATVTEDGRFEVTVDLENLGQGIPMSVTVRHDGEVLTREEARIAGCGSDCETATFDRQGDRLTLQAGPGQAITGNTSLEEGAPVTIRLESTNPEQPFLVAKETTVTDEGAFATFLDVSDVEPGSSFRAVVLHDGDQLKETTGRVVACDGKCGPVTTQTPTPTPTLDPDEFGFKSIVEVTDEETAYVPVTLGDADAATLVVGSKDVNYVVNATVRDGNGDDRVGVLFDAAAAGTDGRTLTVANESDELTVTDPEPDLGDSIDPADYDTRLYEGDTATGKPDDVGVLVVRESGPGDGDQPALEKSVLRTSPGDVASLPIHLGSEYAAVVTIGSDADNYGIAARVTDGDGDDRVVLRFRTDNAGTDRPTLDVEGTDDDLTITDPEPSLDGPLPPTEYDIALYPGQKAANDPVSIGTLSVGSGSDGPRTAVLDDSQAGDRGIDLGGVGALAAGAVFAVVGVGLLLGLFRS